VIVIRLYFIYEVPKGNKNTILIFKSQNEAVKINIQLRIRKMAQVPGWYLKDFTDGQLTDAAALCRACLFFSALLWILNVF